MGPNEEKIINLKQEYPKIDYFELSIPFNCYNAEINLKTGNFINNQTISFVNQELDSQILDQIQLPNLYTLMHHSFILLSNGKVIYLSIDKYNNIKSELIFEPQLQQICNSFAILNNGLVLQCQIEKKNIIQLVYFGFEIIGEGSIFKHKKQILNFPIIFEKEQINLNFNELQITCSRKYIIRYAKGVIDQYIEIYTYTEMKQDDGEYFDDDIHFILNIKNIQNIKRYWKNSITQNLFILYDYQFIFFNSKEILLFYQPVNQIEFEYRIIESFYKQEYILFNKAIQMNKQIGLYHQSNEYYRIYFVTNLYFYAFIIENDQEKLNAYFLPSQIMYQLKQKVSNFLVDNKIDYLIDFQADQQQLYFQIQENQSQKSLIHIYAPNYPLKHKQTIHILYNSTFQPFFQNLIFYEDLNYNLIEFNFRKNNKNTLLNILKPQIQYLHIKTPNIQYAFEDYCQIIISSYSQFQTSQIQLIYNIFTTNLDQQNAGIYYKQETPFFEFLTPKGSTKMKNIFNGPALQIQQDKSWSKNMTISNTYTIDFIKQLEESKVIEKNSKQKLQDIQYLLGQEAIYSLLNIKYVDYSYQKIFFIVCYFDNSYKVFEIQQINMRDEIAHYFYSENHQILAFSLKKDEFNFLRYIINIHGNYNFKISKIKNFEIQRTLDTYYVKSYLNGDLIIQQNQTHFIKLPLFDVKYTEPDPQLTLNFFNNYEILILKLANFNFLDHGIFYYKYQRQISIFSADFENNNEVQLIHTIPMNKYFRGCITNINNYDFKFFRQKEDVKLLIINTLEYIICEYNMYNYTEPVFSRKYINFDIEIDDYYFNSWAINDILLLKLIDDNHYYSWSINDNTVDNFFSIIPYAYYYNPIPKINQINNEQRLFVLYNKLANQFQVYKDWEINLFPTPQSYQYTNQFSIEVSAKSHFSSVIAKKEFQINFSNQVSISKKFETPLQIEEINEQFQIEIDTQQIFNGPVTQYSISGDQQMTSLSTYFTYLQSAQFISIDQPKNYFQFQNYLFMYIEDSIIQEQSYMLLSYFSHSFTNFNKFSIEFGQFSDLKIDKIVNMWGNIKDYNQLDEYPNLILFKGYSKSDNPLNYQIVLIENKLIVNQETLYNDYLNAFKNSKTLHTQFIINTNYDGENKQDLDFINLQPKDISLILPFNLNKNFYLFFFLKNRLFNQNIEQKDGALYVIIGDKINNTDPQLYFLAEFTSIDFDLDFLNIKDLYGTEPQQIDEITYRITIFFHDSFQTICSAILELKLHSFKKMRAKIIKFNKKKLNLKGDNNLQENIMNAQYDLLNDGETLEISVIAQNQFRIQKYNIKTLFNQQIIFNDYPTCHFMSGFQPSLYSKLDDQIAVLCEYDKSLISEEIQEDRVQKKIKFFKRYQNEFNLVEMKDSCDLIDINTTFINFFFNDDLKQKQFYQFSEIKNVQNYPYYNIKYYRVNKNIAINFDAKNKETDSKVNFQLNGNNDFVKNINYPIIIDRLQNDSLKQLFLFIIIPIILCLIIIGIVCLQRKYKYKDINKKIQSQQNEISNQMLLKKYKNNQPFNPKIDIDCNQNQKIQNEKMGQIQIQYQKGGQEQKYLTKTMIKKKKMKMLQNNNQDQYYQYLQSLNIIDERPEIENQAKFQDYNNINKLKINDNFEREFLTETSNYFIEDEQA